MVYTKMDMKNIFLSNFIVNLWWKFMPGTTILVPWPREQIFTILDDGIYKTTTDRGFIPDTNDHYRPFLEENVGKQGIDWNWKLHIIREYYTPGYEDEDRKSDMLAIKFRKGKEHWATIAKLRWS